MNSNNNISIIMSVYNMEAVQYQLCLAIESILNQTISDYEFIICDDGSTDLTYKILEKYALEDKRIKLLCNRLNKGLAYSLNKCMNAAQGEYIARMDGDDISDIERLKKERIFLDEHPEYSLVSSCAFLFDNKGIWGRRQLKEHPQVKDFLMGSPILHAGMMIRKQVLEAVGGYRVAWETQRAEDYDLFMRIYAEGKRAYTIQEPLYCIREDTQAYKRRKYKYRIQEAVVRYKGFKKLHLLPKSCLFILKPLIVGLIPSHFLKKLRKEER